MINVCRICRGDNMREAIDLGHHPLADRFLTESMLVLPEVRYPLVVDLCMECGYAGNRYVIPAADRYLANDYSYTAGNSPVAISHFAELAGEICDMTITTAPVYPIRNVMDIGGNDGTLLMAIRAEAAARSSYGQSDLELLNIEPAANIAMLSRDAGIKTREIIWGDESRGRLRLDGIEPQDLIVCTNVLNHASDPLLFLRDVASTLRPGGWFVFEVPSLERMLATKAFDTIYHEHVSYFGMSGLMRALSIAGLQILSARDVPYMGGSVRVYARKPNIMAGPASARLGSMWPSEIADGFDAMHLHAITVQRRLFVELSKASCDGRLVYAIGAAAKGNTLLNYCQLGANMIGAVIDTSPHKIGKRTPGTHLRIVDDSVLETARPTTCLILPWNIHDHLAKKYAADHITFVSPVV